MFYNDCRVICSKCGCIYTVTLLATQYWHDPYVVEICTQIFNNKNNCPNCGRTYEISDEIVCEHLLYKLFEEIERGEWCERNL